MASQAFWMACTSSSLVSYCFMFSYTTRARIPHRFSIGFRSGASASHHITLTYWSSRYHLATRAVCMEALLC
ncbi:hypothetical protein PF005_g1180 [Phytophthora fragariae]|uniref:Uncharacterized protein n=1 Tax=Phytophthora fragariae TaxID=53985 RepID=A0A6A4AIG7_9STRA|nr:hypothetical protein PF003_g321 [Phytophthora fragariae]KAE8949511.1 hypothetical protein PF009_g947 [Phytophthora fragariae]KAE9030105.1 hypothetical protein PF011_g747 [Phytophthora fragariae]KAE9133167.1 hypothetical protein PF007_g3454 [Phytophthora fragariae]KAE9153042.1 hypothetical protein PF006_g2802 [Phytophthora fragariae]